MKIIIAGSRTFNDFALLSKVVEDSLYALNITTNQVTEIVSGAARGADLCGESWARKHDIPIKRFPADWDRYGKKAGYIRNAEMAEYGDVLIAFRINYSKGTTHMINLMDNLNKPVFKVDISE